MGRTNARSIRAQSCSASTGCTTRTAAVRGARPTGRRWGASYVHVSGELYVIPFLAISGSEGQKVNSAEENQAAAQKEEAARGGEGREAKSLRRGRELVNGEKYSGFESKQGRRERESRPRRDEEVVTVQSLLQLTNLVCPLNVQPGASSHRLPLKIQLVRDKEANGGVSACIWVMPNIYGSERQEQDHDELESVSLCMEHMVYASQSSHDDICAKPWMQIQIKERSTVDIHANTHIDFMKAVKRFLDVNIVVSVAKVMMKQVWFLSVVFIDTNKQCTTTIPNPRLT